MRWPITSGEAYSSRIRLNLRSAALRIEALVPAGEMVLDQEARTIAERLGLDPVIEIIAEALPGFRAEVLGAGLGRAEDPKLHLESLPAIGPEHLSAIRCSRDRLRSTARSW